MCRARILDLRYPQTLIGSLTNAGTIVHTGSGNLALESNQSLLGSTLTNLATGLYDIQGDGGIIPGLADNGLPVLLRNLGIEHVHSRMPQPLLELDGEGRGQMEERST